MVPWQEHYNGPHPMRALAPCSGRSSVTLAAAVLLVAFATIVGVPAAEAVEQDGDSSFLFVPYPITEPALGNGVLAGPVWMRSGPKREGEAEQPQAFGAGALWTDGGSRGWVAFDRRAWGAGDWLSTAVVLRADLRLTYDGLSPTENQDQGFGLQMRGASVEAEHRLAGPASWALRAFSVTTRVDFSGSEPVELAASAAEARSNGLALGWKRDTRDDIYLPSKGGLAGATVTAYLPAVGASFSAQSLRLHFVRYLPVRSNGVLGLRLVGEATHGDAPFYLRPYVGLRGIPALRYAGETVVTMEAEYRHRVGARLDLLLFGGAGRASAHRESASGSRGVSAGGVGFRFRARKYFGLSFGIDVAVGPEGRAGYVQIGNAWGR